MKILILIFVALFLSGANFKTQLNTLETKVGNGSAKLTDISDLKTSVSDYLATLPVGAEKEAMDELESELQHTLEHYQEALDPGRHPDVQAQQKAVALGIINRMKVSEETRAK